jgi:membrane protease YdiL (CAAX protease family)
VVAFLVLAFGFGWISLIPILLARNGFGVLPVELPLTVVQTLATVLGLALPAFLVTAATGGKEGVRDLLGRLLRWRVGLHWYLFVLFGLPMGVLLSAIVLHGAAPLGALARNWALLFTAFLPGVIVPFLHTNLWEELGWTGFLQSTLQDRRGPLLASLIVVPFFALFHLPARFVAGWIVDDHTPLAQVPTVALGYFVSAAVVAVFLRVLIMWIYNGSGRSLIVVGLFHSAFNITIGNEVMPELLNLPASETSLMCFGGARGARSGGRRVHQGSSRLPGATGRGSGSSGSTEDALITSERDGCSAPRDRRSALVTKENRIRNRPSFPRF